MYKPLLFLPITNLTSNNIWSTINHATDSPCPFLGQIYPPPTSISTTDIWQAAVSAADEALSVLPAVQLNTTSYAVQFMSLHESLPIFEHYGKGINHVHGPDGLSAVDGNTVFRIASVSKLFTVYALLVKCGFRCFEEPITNYVTELKQYAAGDSVAQVDWEDVTVGALASQLSGIGRDYALGDLSSTQHILPGAPVIDPGQFSACGALPNQPPCNRSESIRLMLNDAPNFPTWYTPSYSNMAFQLLGYVLENITGQSFGEALNDLVIGPLNLAKTTTSLPHNLNTTVSIPGDTMFKWNVGDQAPGGGIYSSTRDLVNHALAILNHTQLSASQVRRWLKPHSHTSSLLVSVGSPWEIGRVPGLSPNHIIEVYTKAGSLLPYTTEYGIIPELEIVYAANSLTNDLTTGASTFTNTVLLHTLAPLFEIAKSQAAKRFGGTYVDVKPGSNSSFTVATDDEIGLVVTEWISDGFDYLQYLESIGTERGGVRLFPTSLKSRKGGMEKMAFRATLLHLAGQCVSWVVVDSLRWAGVGLDLVVFEMERSSHGRASAVELPFLRVKYDRVDDEVFVQGK